jgi:hypothetical protein
LVGVLPHGETIDAVIAFRCCRSFFMHCVTNAQGTKISPCNRACRNPHCSCVWTGLKKMAVELLFQPPYSVGVSPLRLSWVQKGSDMRPALCDKWGSPGSRQWFLTNSWNRNLPQDDLQTLDWWQKWIDQDKDF